MKHFFSIITVVLDDLVGFKLTMESLRSQDITDYEWIIIDGGSNDGTVNFLSTMSQEGVKWISEKDTGIYDAMNKGLKFCSSNYVLFLNAGDYFINSSILKSIHSYIRDLNFPPDILFSGANYIFQNGIKLYRAPKQIDKYIWHGLPALHQATFYNINLFVSTKYDDTFLVCGDYYLTARFFTKGINVSYFHWPIVNFVVGGLSYHHPYKLLSEPYLIQKNVLNLPSHIRYMSILKRLFSLFGYYLISMKWIRILISKDSNY